MTTDGGKQAITPSVVEPQLIGPRFQTVNEHYLWLQVLEEYAGSRCRRTIPSPTVTTWKGGRPYDDGLAGPKVSANVDALPDRDGIDPGVGLEA